ncbi:MAG: DUF2294 domain-containing protein [Cyanobacteria bacterium J06636_16]
MNDSNLKTPTRGQLERTLSQQIQKLYREHLDHATGKVSCQLSKDKLVVIIEDALTQPEQLLLERQSDQELVEQVRSDLDAAIQPGMVSLVEEILSRKVSDLISDTTLNTGRSGIIVILAEET